MLRPLIDLLATEISGQACMDHVLTITRYHRIQASPGYRAAAEALLRILRQGGVESSITTYPATGRNREWTHLTPQEWDCSDAELWLLGPNGAPAERLAWYAEMELSIIQRSVSTEATAELVVVDGAENAGAWSEKMAGKIALVGNGDIHRIWTHARKAGVIGLLTDRMSYNPPNRPEGDLADARQYTSFWWSPDEPKGWGFVLTPRQGARLRKLAAAGPVRLSARVASRFYDGTIENVEAVIPGESDQEVLVVSHLCHPKPSANDNATGPAVCLEAARALQKLIATGRLPRPKRTIRFLHPPEMTGTYAHLANKSGEELAKVVAALNIDMVGQNQELTGSVLLCEYPPLASPSFPGDLMALILAEVARETASLSGFGTRYATFRHAVTSFSGGSDHYILSDPMVDIPCPMVIQWPDRFYHTSADTPDKSDPAMLKRVSLMTATFAWFLANAGLAEATWLATEMAAAFPAQLHDALAGAADPEAMAGFRVDRKLTSIDSLNRLITDEERVAFIPVLERLINQVQLSAEMELQRVVMNGLVRTDVAAAAAEEPVQGWTGKALLSQVYPLRVMPGPISLRNHLDQLPETEEESWRAFNAAHPGAAAIADYLCYWTDGTRSLAEILRLTELETGKRNDAWSLGYLQLLARLNLVKGV
ncbi:MAG: DUF4910 domain-containing protein [Bacillota bacterium]